MHSDVPAGWEQLIVDLDARLAAIDPDYAVAQIKEKFGALRYYIDPSPAPIYFSCCLAYAAAAGLDLEDDEDSDRFFDSAHFDDPIHHAQQRAVSLVYKTKADRLYAAIHEAEQLSYLTCWSCGGAIDEVRRLALAGRPPCSCRSSSAEEKEEEQ